MRARGGVMVMAVGMAAVAACRQGSDPPKAQHGEFAARRQPHLPTPLESAGCENSGRSSWSGADGGGTMVSYRMATGAQEHALLSGFEQRCLLRHLGDCHEAVALALSGATDAGERHPAAAEALAPICQALQAAERRIEEARRVAWRQMAET